MADLLEFPSAISRSQMRGSPTEDRDAHAPAHPDSPTPVPADAEARALALDIRRSFIVEAPAGSGKTGLLVQRFLNLLGSPSASAPEEILAITFTRKATAELRQRIVAELDAAATGAPLEDPASPFQQRTRAMAKAALDQDLQLGWDLLTAPRRLRIQTIDSLCMEIAGAMPLLAGAAARTPVDDASELYRKAARNTLRQLGGSDRQLHDALHTVLLHRDGNLADVETLLAEMLQTREQWAELVPLDRASLSDEFLNEQVRLRLERNLEHVVCAGLSRALKTIPASALAELATLAHTYSGDPGYRGGPNPFRLCGDHPGSPAAEAAHLDHWRALIDLVFTGSRCEWRKSFNHRYIGIKLSELHKERLAQIIADVQCEPVREALEAVRCLPPAKYPDNQWLQAKALFRLLLHALTELKLLFASTGQCDFTEFSLSARQALALHAEDFAASSAFPLRHLLVDEMQDTSSAQYDLLIGLTRTWDGSSQTIFLVGDPKQSIYLFRQARVERFLRTAQDGAFGDIPLQPLRLTANFRSRPAVVEAVNRDFAHLFAAPGQALAPDTVDVPFVAATSTRPDLASTGLHWHCHTDSLFLSELGTPLVTTASPSARVGSAIAGTAANLALAASADVPPSTVQGSQTAQQDAATIRQIVERWRATPLPPDRQATPTRPARPWRIAVLAAARSHLAPIAAEFTRAAIPYRAVKVEALQDRPEVLDAFALTRALHHPANRTAWLAVLRAPWCGLTAADLLTLTAEGDPAQTKSTIPHLVGNRATFLSRDGQARLERAWPTLQVALSVASRTSFRDGVERAWRSLGADATLLHSERNNVDRYFALLRESEADGQLDLRTLKHRLKDLYAEPAPHPDAVELSTIHRAKGLEWDVVIVPELGRRGQAETSRLLNWLELEFGGEPAVLLAPIHGKGDDPSRLYRWLNGVRTRRLEAERKRIFYVACTRAREELHLFATAKQSKSGLNAAPGSLLHACWPAAASHFAQDSAAPPAGAISINRSGESLRPASLQTAPWGAEAGRGLALAAAGSAVSAEAASDAPLPGSSRYLPRLTRLPLGFNPGDRFRQAAMHRLPYTPASDLPHQEALARPQGSVAVRALGNVVHRFLEQMALRLAANGSADALRRELPTWLDRLTASLRGEGLAPAEASREAGRALTLLTNTLADPVGLWLLSPHPAAASERALTSATAGLLRVDRTFQAGPAPLSAGTETVWIVDFKTTEHGGRSPDAFATEQRELYSPQLARYATALQSAAKPINIQLGLYYPAIPRLIHWPSGA